MRSTSSEDLKLLLLNFKALVEPKWNLHKSFKEEPTDLINPSIVKLPISSPVVPYVSQKYEIFITKQKKSRGSLLIGGSQTPPPPPPSLTLGYNFTEHLGLKTLKLQKYENLEGGLRGSQTPPDLFTFHNDLDVKIRKRNNFLSLEEVRRRDITDRQFAPYLEVENAFRKITSRERIQNRLALEIYGWKSYLPKMAADISEWRRRTLGIGFSGIGGWGTDLRVGGEIATLYAIRDDLGGLPLVVNSNMPETESLGLLESEVGGRKIRSSLNTLPESTYPEYAFTINTPQKALNFSNSMVVNRFAETHKIDKGWPRFITEFNKTPNFFNFDLLFGNSTSIADKGMLVSGSGHLLESEIVEIDEVGGSSPVPSVKEENSQDLLVWEKVGGGESTEEVETAESFIVVSNIKTHPSNSPEVVIDSPQTSYSRIPPKVNATRHVRTSGELPATGFKFKYRKINTERENLNYLARRAIGSVSIEDGVKKKSVSRRRQNPKKKLD